tara:strand:- start:4838 stop:7960 length:3123 start_codon:yes stop_codon:yes gene_type:complete
MPSNSNRDLISVFAQHRVAANLLMAVMILFGAWGLSKLNVQFFPNFAVEVVTVHTLWDGASAEDVEKSLTQPIEYSLRNTDNLKKMSSTSSQGVSVISLEFPEGTDMGAATLRAEELVNGVRNLPDSADKPKISHAVKYEQIARMLIFGPKDLDELRPIVHQIDRELSDKGIARIKVNGLPEEEILIQVPQKSLEELSMPLSEISQKISTTSKDLPAGTVGKNDVVREIRTISQRRSESGFEDIPLIADNDGRLIRVRDIATVERRARPNLVKVYYREKPAVEMILERSASADSLQSAKILETWVDQSKNDLPPGINLVVYDASWSLIKDRINLLIKNGLGGLILVVAILFLFLNGRVAFWVTIGIPVSFMATLAIIYVAGGSINMISLFALIMALGIIVDDAIVVGEDALAQFSTGDNPAHAAENGARRMLAPVLSSSLTTIAAFIPLFAISGIIGKFLGDIPFVIVCVIIASLIESFLILPGHLRQSFKNQKMNKKNGMRIKLEQRFNKFRDQPFKNAITWSIKNRLSTVAIALASIVLVYGLMKSDRIGFSFFPNVPENIIVATAAFVSGTPREKVEKFGQEIEKALYETDEFFGGKLLKVSTLSNGLGYYANARKTKKGDQFTSVFVELIPSDTRNITNEDFIKKWESKLELPSGLEYFVTAVRKGGHPGRNIEVRLSGGSIENLKKASLDLSEVISAIPGAKSVEDDAPYGQQQLVFSLNALGDSLGLTVDEVGKQFRGSFDGYLTQIFNESNEEIEVRVSLPDKERFRLTALDDFNLFLKNKKTVSMQSVVDLEERRGFQALRHSDGELAVTVYADVNSKVANSNKIRSQLRQQILPALEEKYNIDWKFAGRAEDQKATLEDMKYGAFFALAMIYIVLAWVFGSYSWPLIVMAIIPFGLVGALLGHFVMDVTPTILSMFGLFALSGVVVNDSIILVVFYKNLVQQGVGTDDAIIRASCLRLRAVLLTSLTTIAGLLPLLFETSLQAQFLIPMAISISFGLGFSTLVVLFLVPVLLSWVESIRGQKNNRSIPESI